MRKLVRVVVEVAVVVGEEMVEGVDEVMETAEVEMVEEEVAARVLNTWRLSNRVVVVGAGAMGVEMGEVIEAEMVAGVMEEEMEVVEREVEGVMVVELEEEEAKLWNTRQ